MNLDPRKRGTTMRPETGASATGVGLARVQRAIALAVVVLWGSGASAQCKKDTDCKGDRVCVEGTCTSEHAAPAPAPAEKHSLVQAPAGAYRLHFTSHLEKDDDATDARLRLGRRIGFGYSTVFASGSAGFVSGSGHSASYEDICISPCEFDFNPGTYLFGYVLPERGRGVPTQDVTLLPTSREMEAQYVSRASVRTAGFVGFLASVGVGLVLMIASMAGQGVSWATFDVGCGFALASLVGIPFAFMPDVVNVKVR
jgi:hypothetical protein